MILDDAKHRRILQNTVDLLPNLYNHAEGECFHCDQSRAMERAYRSTLEEKDTSKFRGGSLLIEADLRFEELKKDILNRVYPNGKDH